MRRVTPAALLLCAAFISVNSPLRAGAMVQQPPERQEDMDARHAQLDTPRQERIRRRQERQEAYEKLTDSLVISSSYRFIPNDFRMEPAGKARYLTNPNFELTVRGDQADIFLPFYRGLTPPYRLIILNTIIVDLGDYKAASTQDGWLITFRSVLYASTQYEFTLKVESRTGYSELQIRSEYNNTVTYNGQLTEIF